MCIMQNAIIISDDIENSLRSHIAVARRRRDEMRPGLGGYGHGFLATDTCPWHIYVCVCIAQQWGTRGPP